MWVASDGYEKVLFFLSLLHPSYLCLKAQSFWEDKLLVLETNFLRQTSKTQSFRRQTSIQTPWSSNNALSCDSLSELISCSSMIFAHCTILCSLKHLLCKPVISPVHQPSMMGVKILGWRPHILLRSWTWLLMVSASLATSFPNSDVSSEGSYWRID